ncbi:acyltransferase family protein [Sphingomonas sp. 1P08PE]|uniref:acyltransferase family protein n=1 Tax=Sphingomonas sp. 1P08PE TaxID=554122 RepID=UPI0039A23A74
MTSASIASAAPSADPGPAVGGRAASDAAAAKGHGRFAVLDGWRATSICLVLAGHLLPLGPGRWGVNVAVAGTGMALFFILSGFLITRFLESGADLRVFIIRRFFRIVPLAWVVMTILLVIDDAPSGTWAANYLFYANLPPQQLVGAGGHLWSLCVEMHFYVGIALFVAICGRRSLIALPLIAIAATALRMTDHRYMDIVTWFRIDEILAGGILALCYSGRYGEGVQRLLGRINPYWLMPLLVLSALPAAGPFNYPRPYIAAALIGATLFNPPPLLSRVFSGRIASYVAAISYAVYILHIPLAATWLGSGSSKLVTYAKRPLLFAAITVLAHLSTYRFEQPCIAFAKKLTRGIRVRAPE